MTRACGLGAVADRDHDGRGGLAHLGPLALRLPPVIAQQVVGVQHQVGQRLLRPGLAVQVVLDVRVVIDVIEPRFVGPGVRHGVIAHHDARRLHQPALDGVVEPEVAEVQ